MEICICVWLWLFTCLHNRMIIKFTIVLIFGERLLSDWTNSTLVGQWMLSQLTCVLSQPSLPTTRHMYLPSLRCLQDPGTMVGPFSIAGVSKISSRNVVSISSLCASDCLLLSLLYIFLLIFYFLSWSINLCVFINYIMNTTYRK